VSGGTHVKQKDKLNSLHTLRTYPLDTLHDLELNFRVYFKIKTPPVFSNEKHILI